MVGLTATPSTATPSLPLPRRTRVYRPRRPRASALFKVFCDHFPAFLLGYESKHQKAWGARRHVVERTVGRFLRCGLLEYGFARLQCGSCKGDLLLAFSCRQRGLCASCGAKRSAGWAAWVREELVRPVPHRHLVFTLPKRVRPFFKFTRTLLRDLSGWAYELVRDLMRELAPEPVRPGCVSVLELSGNLLNLQPHVHMIVSDGAFSLCGRRFYPMPPRLWRLLEEAFRHKVLKELCERGLLSQADRVKLLSWRHSGFSVFAGQPIAPDQPERLERLARYVRRTHVAESRVRYDEEQDQVIYSSGKKPHPGFKANFRVFEAQDFIAALCGLLPDPKRHEQVAYGEYSNVVRGKRAKAGTAPPLEEQDPLRIRLKKAWQELLKRIYEVDPLRCPCGGTLKRIALIMDPKVIKKILLHLGRWPPPYRPPKQPRPPPPRREETLSVPDPPLSEAEASQLPLWWDQDEAFSQLPFPEEG